MPHFRSAQAGSLHGVATLTWNSVPLFKGQTSYLSPRLSDIQDDWNLHKVAVKSIKIDPPKSVRCHKLTWGAELHAKKKSYKITNKIPTLTCLHQNLWISNNHQETKHYSLFFKWLIKQEDASDSSS